MIPVLCDVTLSTEAIVAIGALLSASCLRQLQARYGKPK